MLLYLYLVVTSLKEIPCIVHVLEDSSKGTVLEPFDTMVPLYDLVRAVLQGPTSFLTSPIQIWYSTWVWNDCISTVHQKEFINLFLDTSQGELYILDR